MAFIKRHINWTAQVDPSDAGLTMKPDIDPDTAIVEANEEPSERSWDITFIQGEDTGKSVLVKVKQPPVYKYNICYYDKPETTDSMHTSGSSIVLTADMGGRISVGQGTISEDGCCEILAEVEGAYVWACGAREWSELGNEIWVSDKTDTGTHKIYPEGETAEYQIDGFDDCDTVRKITETATYNGSLDLWAASTRYKNNLHPEGKAEPSNTFEFYMVPEDSKEECEIIGVEPELNITTDIYGYTWDYVANDIDETEELSAYTITVAPKADTGITGVFSLTPLSTQDIMVNSNVPTGTSVIVYDGGDPEGRISTETLVNANSLGIGITSSAQTTVIGCNDTIEGRSYRVLSTYTPSGYTAQTEEYEFDVNPTSITFNADGTTATTNVIEVLSKKTVTQAIQEVWDDAISPNGTSYASSPSFTATIKTTEVPVGTGETVDVDFDYTKREDGPQPPAPEIRVFFYYKTGSLSGHTIDGTLTVPNSVTSNTMAETYYYVGHTENGRKAIPPSSGYPLQYSMDVTANEGITPKSYQVTTEYMGHVATLELNVEGTGDYDIEVVPSLTFNLRKTISINDVWYVRFVDTNGAYTYGEICPKDKTYNITDITKFYGLDVCQLDKVHITPNMPFKVSVSTETDRDIAPKIYYNNGGTQEATCNIDVHMYLYSDEGCTNDLITERRPDGTFVVGTAPSEQILQLGIVLIFNGE